MIRRIGSCALSQYVYPRRVIELEEVDIHTLSSVSEGSMSQLTCSWKLWYASHL
jgi:hypothetical protein